MMKPQLLLLLASLACASAMWCNDWQHNRCLSRRTYCWKGRVYRCPNADYHCIGRGPCRTANDNPRAPGKWPRYSCIDNTHFDNGGFAKMCAPGTQCWDVSGNQNPCLRKKHRGDCPYGDMGCTDQSGRGREYCQGGQMYICPRGYRCAGKAPCVKLVA